MKSDGSSFGIDVDWMPPPDAELIARGEWLRSNGDVFVDSVVWREWESALQTRVALAHAGERRYRVRREGPSVADCQGALNRVLNANHELVAENDALAAQIAFVEDILRAVLAER